MAARRVYRQPDPIDRAVALSRIDRGGAEACDALIDLAFHDKDGAFVESLCLRLIGYSSDANLRRLAVVCIGRVFVHRS